MLYGYTYKYCVVAPSIALYRCFMYEFIRVNMISIVLLLPFFKQFVLYALYLVVVIVEINFNSIQYRRYKLFTIVIIKRKNEPL